MDDSPQPDIINLAAALTRVGGDAELLIEIAELFLRTAPPLLAQIDQAVARRDAGALERAAHTLKGSVGNFAVGEAFQAALKLELLGRSGQLTGVEEAYQALLIAMERLQPALVTLVESRVVR